MLQLLPGRRTAALAVLVAGVLALPVRAADLDKADPALKWVPADVSFYSSSLHLREQFQTIAKSRAWAKFSSLPLFKMGWQHVQTELAKDPNGPLQQFEAFRKAPENQRLLDLLGDMVSEEVVIFGGGNMGNFVELAMQVAGAMQEAMVTAAMTGQNQPDKAQELIAKGLLGSLNKKPDLIAIPEIVYGFKLRKAEAAKEQQKRLYELLQHAAKQHPEAKFQVKMSKVAGDDFLVVSLPFKNLDISFEKVEKKPGEYDNLARQIKKQTLTISLGVHKGYVLLAVGPSVEVIERLDKGGPSLSSRPEFQKMAKFADKKILDVNYVSRAFNETVTKQQNPFDNISQRVQEGLKQAGGSLPDEMKKRLEKDLPLLAKDLSSLVPKPGAMLSFSFESARGQESYTYDWAEHKGSDGSQPLSLLSHLGGSPILAGVSRSTYNPQTYDTFVKWLKVANSYVEDFVLPQAGDDVKKQYDRIMEIALPILKKINDATRNNLIPSLKDSQTAFVFDGKLASKRWFEGLPAADSELPLPEVAIVCGISDEALFKKAFEEYRSAINDTLAVVSNAAGGLLPQLSLPPPETKKTKNGTQYYYSIPPFLGIDPKFQPNAGLSAKVLALGLSLEHTDRLLADTPLKSKLAVHKDLKRPLAGAFYCDFPAFLKMLSPWVDYGAKHSQAAMGDAKQVEEIVKQIHAVLEVLSVLRETGSVSYQEGDTFVTHSETVFEDIK